MTYLGICFSRPEIYAFICADLSVEVLVVVLLTQALVFPLDASCFPPAPVLFSGNSLLLGMLLLTYSLSSLPS